MEEVLARPDAQDYIMENLHEYQREVDLFEYYKVYQWKAGNYYESGDFAAKVNSKIGLAPPVDPFFTSGLYDELTQDLSDTEGRVSTYGAQNVDQSETQTKE